MSNDQQQPPARNGRAKVWFDTEFIEDGRTIDLLSIGAVREDGAAFYAEFEEADHSKASDWVKANVLPKLMGGTARMPRHTIAESFAKFCGEKPEIWAYYADYDWVALCQLFGTMMDLPKGWPMFCRDVKQLCVDRGNPKLPEQTGEHHALADARWTRQAWEFLSALSETAASPEFVKAALRFAKAHVNSDRLDDLDRTGGEIPEGEYEAADAEYNASKKALVVAFKSAAAPQTADKV